jgi:threonine/homoserine/homoserine lactone efflux protein
VDSAFLDVIARGTVLGLAAGFAPGPLTLLVIRETLHHGFGAGVRVSLAPVLTDLPLIALSALLIVYACLFLRDGLVRLGVLSAGGT